MMPNRAQIIERARVLWHEQRFRDGDPSFNIEPEDKELREDGFLSAAMSDLMRGPDSKNAEWLDQKVKPSNDLKTENFEKTETLIFDVEECLDTGIFISGTSQSGKTNLCKWLVKKLIESGIVCYVIDPSGAWNSGPIKNVVSITGIEKSVRFSDNTVFDVSLLGIRKKIKFVDTICDYLYSLHVNGQTSRREFILLEECQTYLFNGIMRLAMRRESPCENIINLVTVGANFGLRFGIVTQFAAMVDKLPVKISGQRYFGRTSEPNDIAYLKGFLGRDWAAKLKTLQKGEFVYQLRGDIERIKTEVYGQTYRWCNYAFQTQVPYTNTYK